MSEAISKRHHYIPKFYLDGFANETNGFYIFDKIEDKIFKSSPRASFSEKILCVTNSNRKSTNNKLMKTLILLGFALYSVNCSAIIFTGILLSKKTSKPIVYANVGIVGKNVGTTTDINGKFTIDLNDNYDTEILRISSIGFEVLEMKVNDFKSLYKNQSTIYLAEKIFQLNDVIVSKSKKIKHRRLGTKTDNKLLVVGFDTSAQGYETGVFMKIKKTPTFIDSVQVNVCSCETDSVFFRLNVYEYIDSIFVNILREPLYIRIPSSEIKNHKIKIDLSNKNISVSNDFLVSVELLRNIERHKLFFCASILGHNGYMRKTSQANWHKTPNVAPSISAYITY